MLTQQFLNLVHELQADLEATKSAQATLKDIAKDFPRLATEVNEFIPIHPARFDDHRKAVSNLLNESAATISTIDVFAFSRQLDQIENAIVTFTNELGTAPAPSLDQVILALHEFRSAYQAFISLKHDPKATLVVVVTSKGLLDLLNAVQESFAIVAMQLEPEPPSSDIHRLAIVFGDTPGYQELLARLAAILAIWNAICEAFDLDPNEHTPEVSRIERGSLIVEILGHPIVIATFTFVLANWKPIRAWLDKSEQTRANLETAIKLTQLVDWLDRRGVDTSNLSVLLLKAVTKESKNIAMVAEHTHEITRNKESAAIAGVMRQLDYKNHAQRRIEHRPQ